MAKSHVGAESVFTDAVNSRWRYRESIFDLEVSTRRRWGTERIPGYIGWRAYPQRARARRAVFFLTRPLAIAGYRWAVGRRGRHHIDMAVIEEVAPFH